VKDGWEVRPLGEVAEVIAGQSPPGTAYNEAGKGLPFYQGKKNFSDRFLSPPTVWTTEVTKRAERGDILMSVRAPVGPINEAVEPICIGRGLAAIRANGAFVDDFLWYRLLALQPEIAGTDGAVFASINRRQVAALPIPLPPLEEQRRIVAVLDEAFEGLARTHANIEANLADAGGLRTKAIAAVFEDLEEASPSLLLKDVALDFGRGKSKHRPRNDPRLYGGDYPFIQTGDVRAADRYLRAHSQSYNELGLTQSKLWPEGTVCVTIAANIAETATLTYPACFPDSVIGIVPREDAATAEYIEYVLQYARVRLQARGRGAAQDNINLKTFETEYFPFPSVADQESAVRQLDEVHDRIGQFVEEGQEQLADLDTLRQSLLARAFRGELT